jgi:hypothetical protein
MRSRYEQLIEYIINDETDKAKELFHSLVVEKSRDLYNELVAEDFGEEGSMDQTDDMMHDIEADHEGVDSHDDMGDEDDFGDHEGEEHGEEHEEAEIEDRVMDLEDALDELKAEFEALMADEQHEPEHNDGVDDPDFGNEEMPEGMVREYVEKVASPGNTEGLPVGAVNSFKSSTQKKSVVASKNDMGGTAKNIAQKSTNEDPDGKAYKGPSNEYSKGEGKLKGAGSFENVPGANAGKAFSNAKKPQSSEGKFSTGGGPNVNKKNVLPR